MLKYFHLCNKKVLYINNIIKKPQDIKLILQAYIYVLQNDDTKMIFQNFLKYKFKMRTKTLRLMLLTQKISLSSFMIKLVACFEKTMMPRSHFNLIMLLSAGPGTARNRVNKNKILQTPRMPSSSQVTSHTNFSHVNARARLRGFELMTSNLTCCLLIIPPTYHMVIGWEMLFFLSNPYRTIQYRAKTTNGTKR